MSPGYTFTADTAAPRLSRANSWNRFKTKGPDTTDLTSRLGAATPTRPELVSELVPGSPSTSPGDHIQEGLGSLNRWSQSTSSSKGSPMYDSYHRTIPPKASAYDDYTSPKGGASAERSTIPHLPPRVAAPTNDESPLQGPQSPHSIGAGHYMQVLELGDHSDISAFSTDAIDSAPSHQDHGSTSIATSLFQNPWSRSGTDAQAANRSSQMFTGSEHTHGKRRRGHSQKAMLSKALQKANTAVLLDNAANFEGAMEAYNDACQLLQHVMLRSSGGEDEKSKLQEIRDTYMIRVTELQRMDFSFTEPNSKALPERPLSQESYSEMFQSIEEDENEESHNESGNSLQRSSDDHQPVLDEARSGSGQASRTLSLDDDSAHHLRYNDWALLSTHAKDAYESTSWLDTIDESGASSPTSTRSKLSSVYLRQGGSRHFSHGTEAEFDAALDAAVEAAYDEGFEPAFELNEQYDGGIDNDDIVANARRNIELAKQKVREAEHEAQVAMARGREVRHLQQPFTIDHSYGVDLDYLDEEAEEEERLLEEMTRGYIMDDFNFDLQSNVDKPTTQEEDNNLGVPRMPSPARPIGKVPSAPDNLGKLNSGAKSFRARNVSVPGTDALIDSPDTPSSAFPPFDIHKGAGVAAGPILPTPTGAGFAPTGLPSGGLYLFDSHIHSPTNLGSPNATATNAPAPLEHCPESFLLRPFWLMRCIYQTIAHPSGGYLTTKLFVPRDAWRVKNVKIKAVEEKVSNCDLLTAALLKLAKVDTYDADAILEEMQSLETVLDQVQSSLSKKLSGEVGVQGAMALFKASQSSDDAATVDTLPSKTSSGASKSYLTSWRKLRSKNSGFGGTTSQSSVKETSRDNLIINSLPMSSIPNIQPVKRNTTQLQFNGPNANYMSALARLCDAVQVLDQIAQQVEDPGLKHSSPTLVGLELSTRHAAEFFGFYICRFALNDIAMMVDKFIKRGSEWVLI
ncbi:hypothetical protein APSETT445_008363 [Aspergillus pseudonomiae]